MCVCVCNSVVFFCSSRYKVFVQVSVLRTTARRGRCFTEIELFDSESTLIPDSHRRSLRNRLRESTPFQNSVGNKNTGLPSVSHTLTRCLKLQAKLVQFRDVRYYLKLPKFRYYEHHHRFLVVANA